MIDIDAFLAEKPPLVFYDASHRMPHSVDNIIGRKCDDTFTYTTPRGQRRQRYDKTSFICLMDPDNSRYPQCVSVTEKYFPVFINLRIIAHFSQLIGPMVRNGCLGPVVVVPQQYETRYGNVLITRGLEHAIPSACRVYAGETEAIMLQGYYDEYTRDK